MAIRQISVTQLKYACLDPKWREQWIRGDNPSTLLFPCSETLPVQGTMFHKLAEEYVGWLTSSENRIPADLADADALWHEMYERFAQGRLTQLLNARKIDSAYHLGQALRAFCGRVSELRDRTLKFQSWQDIYLTKEFLIQDVRFDVGDSSLFISGQIDAVRTHPDHGIEIVDYKLSHGSNMRHDLLQIAVYARLMSMTKPGLCMHGVLEYYEPSLHEVSVSHEDLGEIFQELVEPVFHELVGEQTPDFTGMTSESESSDHRVSTNHRTSDHEFVSSARVGLACPTRQDQREEKFANHRTDDDLSEDIQRCYAAFKLNVDVIDKHEAPQLVRYKVRPASGVKVVSLANRAEDLQVALSLTQPPLIEAAQGCVTIDIPKKRPDTIFWGELMKVPVRGKHESFVSFPVGVGMDNQVITADFADPNMCHALVAGASGSGKSEFLKSLVASLIIKNRPETLKLSIIDPKILTFGSFSDCAFLTDPILTDTGSAIPCLDAAVEEMDARYTRLGNEGFESLTQRFRNGKTDIPFHIIIFDEFADLILAGRDEKKAFETLVARLAAKGRAAGIHLVLTTQRPDSKIVTGLIKANLPLKICLRVTTSRNSQIILDQPGGESLLGRGDLLCDRGRAVERAQSPYVSRDELLKMLVSQSNRHDCAHA